MTRNAESAPEKRMARDYFFPTPAYHTDLVAAKDLNPRLIADIRAWRQRDPGGTFRSNVPQLGGWHSPTDMHQRPEFTELTCEIFEFIHGVFTDQGYDDAYEPVCDSMWANINPRGAFNRHHTHPHALWSGVYYVRTPDDCGLLCLTDPRSQAHVMTPYFNPQRRAAHSWAEVYYQPVAGRLIAFPGWLVHSTHPNLASARHRANAATDRLEGARAEARAENDDDRLELERISVSFNFHQRRRGIDPAAASAGEIARADLLTRRGNETESDCARDVAFRSPRNRRLLAALEPRRRSGNSVATDAPARLRAMDAVAEWPALQRDPAHSLPCVDFDSHEGSRP